MSNQVLPRLGEYDSIALPNVFPVMASDWQQHAYTLVQRWRAPRISSEMHMANIHDVQCGQGLVEARVTPLI